MITIYTLIALVRNSLSPIKLSLTVIIASIIVRVSVVVRRRISVAPSAMVISFSSGIIILFCYCAAMSYYERKEKQNAIYLIILATLSLVAALEENMIETTENSIRIVERYRQFLTVAIALVLVTIVAVNKRIYNKKKSLRRTY